MDDFPLDCGWLARRPITSIILLRDGSRKSVDELDHCRVEGGGTPPSGADRERSVRMHAGFHAELFRKWP